MKITEWFDVKNSLHIEAYKHLMKMGTWPNDFLPDSVEVSPTWQMGIAMKLAEAYIDSFNILYDLDIRDA